MARRKNIRILAKSHKQAQMKVREYFEKISNGYCNYHYARCYHLKMTKDDARAYKMVRRYLNEEKKFVVNYTHVPDGAWIVIISFLDAVEYWFNHRSLH